MTIKEFGELHVKTVQRWSGDNAARLAASLAFYAILSLAPLLVFAIAVSSLFLDPTFLRNTLLHEARTQIGGGAADLVRAMIHSREHAGANTAAGVVSIVLALFGASGMFTHIRLSVNTIWRVHPARGGAIKAFLRQEVVSVLMALIFLALILVWISMDSTVSYIRDHTSSGFVLWPLVSFVVSVAFLTGVFGVTFKSLPRGYAAWKDAWLPALETAIGFSAAKYLLSLYFGLAHVGNAYGSAGALVVILIWLYYSAQIFFFGVELTHIFAYSHGSHRRETEGELEMS